MCTGNAGVGAGAAEDVLGGVLVATGYGAPVGAGLIASGTGTALNAYAQNQALKQQDNIAAQGIIKQAALQKTGSNNVQALTGQLAQSNAKTQAASSAQLKAYQAALQQGSNISASASPDVPGSSKAYKAEQSSSSGSASDYVNAIANSAATTEGTQLERVGEGEQMGNTATTLGQLQGQSNEQNYLTKLGIQGTQANPWLESLGTLLQAGGAAYSAGAGLGAGGASAAADTSSGLSGAADVGSDVGDAAGTVGLGSGAADAGLAGTAGTYILPAGGVAGTTAGIAAPSLDGGASALGAYGGAGSFGAGLGAATPTAAGAGASFMGRIANAIQSAQRQRQLSPYMTGNTTGQ